MSDTTSTFTFSTIASPVTQTRTIIATPTSSNASLVPSLTAYDPNGGSPFPSGGATQDMDPYAGPSVYLYGFLAALGLIFIISVTIAYNGYRSRRLLRTRVEQAISRGVYVSGYTEEELRTLGRGRRGRLPIMSKPLMYEGWVGMKRSNENIMATGWDIKPTSIAAIRPYVRPPPRNIPHSSLLQQLVDPLREFWFVHPPEGAEPGQLQGRPTNDHSLSAGVQDTAEHEIDLKGAEGISVSVLILMPNPEYPAASGESTGFFGSGRPSLGTTAPSHPTASSGVASTSTPGRGVDVRDSEVPHQGDLPELIMGTARVNIYKQEEPSVRDDREVHGS